MFLEQFELEEWEQPISEEMQDKAVQCLENGLVLYFPSLPFPLQNHELRFLSPDKIDPKSKNISYHLRKDRLGGTVCTGKDAEELKAMIKRYALTSRQFLERLIPHYSSFLIQGKTSFRPVEIRDRKSSYRKDDTRLHVDSFPSNPTKGQRILRVFTNINLEGKPRVWRLGEPFGDVADKFIAKASPPVWGVPAILKFLGITKDYRTPYDHYMLQIHDKMKGDNRYQETVPQCTVKFPPGSTWIVFTDQVSHAAMEGKDVMEQTFHLPVYGIKNSATSPLRVLEKRLSKTLI